LITLKKPFINTGVIPKVFFAKKYNIPQFFTTTRKYFTSALLMVTALSFQLAVNAQNDNTLLAAGSTFVNPLFSKQFSEYNKKTGIAENNLKSATYNGKPIL
jgi:ABC-type phosphate transport system substrate-binding protein